MQFERSPLKNEAELLSRCQAIEGLSFMQLAQILECQIPNTPAQRKGWTGQAIERVLGANAGSKALPDFSTLGIELKTLPLSHLGKPAESTFVTTISLLTVHKESWLTSQCYTKLRRVLWLPVEGDQRIPFEQRRIGRAILWSPSEEEKSILCEDWTELTFMIGSGRLSEIDASLGQYLQVRPKALNGKSLCYGYDEEGNQVLTLPRGFYLRSRFTATLI